MGATVGGKTMDLTAKKGVVKGFNTGLDCTLTVAAGGKNWFVKKVSITNIDGGAKVAPWETFPTTGGLNSAS